MHIKFWLETGKKPLWKPVSFCKDNTEMGVMEIGCETKIGFNWIKTCIRYFSCDDKTSVP